MKSSIKVEFRSRYSGNFGDKEPIVKVQVEPSDDPRDSLVCHIFDGDPPQVSVFKSFDEKVGNSTTYFIVKKTRHEQVCDIGSEVFQVMLETLPDKEGFGFITGGTHFWFERGSLEKTVSRSEGLEREELLHLPDREVRRKFVHNFLDFIKND